MQLKPPEDLYIDENAGICHTRQFNKTNPRQFGIFTEVYMELGTTF